MKRKQTIFMKKGKKMLSFFAVMSVIIITGMLTGCKGNTSADLVVYGKIFTSEKLRVGDGTSGMNNQMVEAFAVKDGKYVYVGDKAGAKAFVEEGKTEVVMLARAIENCQEYFWGNSAYAVVYCVCRDDYKQKDLTQSGFERMVRGKTYRSL